MTTTASDLIADLQIDGDRVLVSSRLVADRFGKQHKNVLRDIRNQIIDIPDEFGRLNFEPSSYVNDQGKDQPEILMTRSGFSLVAMGLTGREAGGFKVAYITAFEAMERTIAGSVSPHYVESLEDQIRHLRDVLKLQASEFGRGLWRRRQQLERERLEMAGQLTVGEVIDRMLAEVSEADGGEG